ncbi:hypothetical protein C0Q70_02974 [Pomacea canaliculata]|uniref:Uncharacterized protein n=1 Tax=Pomacea canaliculata TaxID=400727 RepID=A0A2T7PRF5_POMCA|nr:hypothetical protein C0Q70_02974 [Pomacea canaliculata]
MRVFIDSRTSFCENTAVRLQPTPPVIESSRQDPAASLGGKATSWAARYLHFMAAAHGDRHSDDLPARGTGLKDLLWDGCEEKTTSLDVLLTDYVY